MHCDYTGSFVMGGLFATCIILGSQLLFVALSARAIRFVARQIRRSWSA